MHNSKGSASWGGYYNYSKSCITMTESGGQFALIPAPSSSTSNCDSFFPKELPFSCAFSESEHRIFHCYQICNLWQIQCLDRVLAEFWPLAAAGWCAWTWKSRIAIHEDWETIYTLWRFGETLMHLLSVCSHAQSCALPWTEANGVGCDWPLMFFPL